MLCLQITFFLMGRCLKGYYYDRSCAHCPPLFSCVLHTFWRLLLSLPVRFFCDVCHHQACQLLYLHTIRGEPSSPNQRHHIHKHIYMYMYLCAPK